ncbi:MAG TPA: serine/threonine-protein kinase [Gemmataceae bacterium]|nr:serine/threonine-protein kinase [Gemmataceae bacterium]
MAFNCPNCQFRIGPKTSPKPGKYTPTCPKCSLKFALVVPADAGAEWITRKLAEAEPAKPAPKPAPAKPMDTTEVTGDFGRGTVGDQTEATGDFGSPLAKDDQTAIHASSPAVEDQTAAFGTANKTEVGNDATIAPESPAKKPKPRKVADTQVDIPNTLGGYEVVKELGRGGMGAVYLARQVSLDRPVALKVMNAKWAKDPIFLARFTREAFAAAQLVHHNVVQIYDIGEQEGINFFSMEFVEGRSLGDMLKKDGKVDVEAAVGHVIQAARGLKFAHDRGMVHRDVKPDNLMLNVHGIVKVADLGLVKTAAMSRADDALAEHNTDPDFQRSNSGLRSLPSDITLAHSAMGSPGYMSPEQCQDAAAVDPRADIYSLGCTLYALLAGRPPFSGGNVFDVMAKHASEPPAPIAGVAKEVNAVVMKALAKKPDDRQQSMDEFIADLERLLPDKGAAAKPTEEHLGILEATVRRFQTASMAKIRKALLGAFFLGSLIAAVIGIILGSWLVTGGVVALVLETMVAYFFVDGIFGKSYLFRRAREWASGARITDWAMGILGLIVFIAVMWLIGLHWVGCGTAAVAVVSALVFHFAIDKALANQRRAAVMDCEHMLKRLRIAGMDEEALRLFVAKNAGQSWEGFFEALFGFEGKLALRPTVEEQAGNRLPHYAGWREPLLARFERAQQARRDAHARKLLQKVESKKLQAQGVDKNAAEAQARDEAAVLVEKAAEIKASRKKPISVKSMLATAPKPAKRPPQPASYHMSKLIDTILGWKVRFVVAIILIALGALWVNGQVSLSKFEHAVGNVAGAETSTDTQKAAKQAAGSLAVVLGRDQHLKIPIVGHFLTWADSLNPLVAGLIILLSTLNGRMLGIVLQLVGATITLLGHQFGVIPAIGPIEPHQLTMILGLVFAVAGVVVARRQ